MLDVGLQAETRVKYKSGITYSDVFSVIKHFTLVVAELQSSIKLQ